jgi:hypothetical protein
MTEKVIIFIIHIILLIFISSLERVVGYPILTLSLVFFFLQTSVRRPSLLSRLLYLVFGSIVVAVSFNLPLWQMLVIMACFYALAVFPNLLFQPRVVSATLAVFVGAIFVGTLAGVSGSAGSLLYLFFATLISGLIYWRWGNRKVALSVQSWVDEERWQ